MFSSRNIHFGILGIILGATTGYVFAVYQAESTLAASAKPAVNNAAPMPDNHPDISGDAQNLDALKKAVDAAPNNADAITQYSNALFRLGRLQEAMDGYNKVVQLDPENLDIRALRGAVLWNMGKPDEAKKELDSALKKNPNHVPSLYGMFLLSIDQKDAAAATQILAKIEKIDPTYEGLPALRSRLAELKAGK